MKSARFRKPILLPCVTLILLTIGFALLANAGLRGPGKYSGVVVFDRWDNCFLLSGPYITYISENVKKELLDPTQAGPWRSTRPLFFTP